MRSVKFSGERVLKYPRTETSALCAGVFGGSVVT